MKMLTSVLLLAFVFFAPQIGAASDDVGQWKTWVITSPEQYRAAAPPDAAATAAEIKTLKEMAAQRTQLRSILSPVGLSSAHPTGGARSPSARPSSAV